MKCIDETGNKYGRLTVIERVKNDKAGNAKWRCMCECGKVVDVLALNLRKGTTQSCGCLNIERAKEANTTHGHYYKPIYGVWRNIKDRCYNHNNKSYGDYGGRGITVCAEWQDFQVFYDWAMSHGYNHNLTIDRIDNNNGYSPDNCRLVDMKTQSNNRRSNHLVTYKGKTQTISQWADELGIKYDTLLTRISKYHWNIERALSV